MSDNTAAEGMAGNAVTLGDGFLLGSGVLVLHPCAFHEHFDMGCGECAIRNGYAASSQTPIPAQCELVDKAALDALRDSVAGCGCPLRKSIYAAVVSYGVCGENDELCEACEAKRDAAIAQLISGDAHDA